MEPAIIRQQVEKIDGVSRTWFEWSWEDETWVKALVVEVTQDTDPNVAHVPSLLEAIWDACRDAQDHDACDPPKGRAYALKLG